MNQPTTSTPSLVHNYNEWHVCRQCGLTAQQVHDLELWVFVRNLP